MANLIDKTIPLKSMLMKTQTVQQEILEESFAVPKSIKKMIVSPNTGSYIKGLTRHHDIPPENAPKLSFAILQVALGRKQLSQLPSILSADVQLSTEKSQKIADEIEKDLFAPIMLDFNKYIAQKKQASKPQSPTEGMGNVVNLKDNPTPKKSFPLPPKK